ncbi:hypothetical protein DMB42_11735 [Nonomuraea sp. WAC 01424]|uniref:hypothetical protein n=1 Tax=Nonomuraea sp. WAC 01424 TaxID=2203200 RepID=UPI000F79EFF3|nr:hypothetical protein [Nonomuraea sp. WAC 01424]RSN12842.1 hypothetical protein DMB42_11735 [Nonomuraea sp. WAC 01424]
MSETGLTADRVLHVLNGGPVDLADLELCVITEIGDGRWTQGVFILGEVLVVNRDGREPFGGQRKPGKWDVEATYTKDWAEAWALSAQVRASHQSGEASQ